MPCLFHANLFALGGARWRFRNISVISVAKMICWVAYFRHLGRSFSAGTWGHSLWLLDVLV